ncbi:hypothetical protein [Achromobacter sp. DH1f]|uniref:hypothetical protein n=1 Tax=Achromobacter sp. DH1f TaxID=1397275 RepID=UPI0012FEEDB6|nr:hypothetical protein [Achromobacter sp. DH1f]
MAVRIYEKDGSVRTVNETPAQASKAESAVRKSRFLRDRRMVEVNAAVETAAQRLKEALDKSDLAKAQYQKSKLTFQR